MEGHISSYQEILTQMDGFTKPASHMPFSAHPTPSSASLALPTPSYMAKNQNILDLANPSYLCSRTEEDPIQDRSSCYRGPSTVSLSSRFTHLQADTVARRPNLLQQPGSHRTRQVKARESSKAWPKFKKSRFVYIKQRSHGTGEQAGASVSRQIRNHS